MCIPSINFFKIWTFLIEVLLSYILYGLGHVDFKQTDKAWLYSI